MRDIESERREGGERKSEERERERKRERANDIGSFSFSLASTKLAIFSEKKNRKWMR